MEQDKQTSWTTSKGNPFGIRKLVMALINRKFI